MSTLQETVKTIDRRTVARAIVAVASVYGTLTLAFSALGLYAMLMVVVTEVLSNAGVWAEFSRIEMRMFRLIFQLPVVATVGIASTHIVNRFDGHDYSLLRAATVLAGGWSFLAVAHIQLMQYGVL